MQCRNTSYILLISTILFSGCASVTVSQVKNNYGSTGANYEKGVRFYRPALHIWILPADPLEKVNTVSTSQTETMTTKKGEGVAPKDDANHSSTENTTQTVGTQIVSTAKGWKTQLVMLPDFSQEYVIDWSSGAGNITANFTLTDGWNLTGFNSSSDSKTTEKAAAALAAIATIVAAAAAALEESPEWKGPGLYRLDPQPDGTLKLGKRILALD